MYNGKCLCVFTYSVTYNSQVFGLIAKQATEPECQLTSGIAVLKVIC